MRDTLVRENVLSSAPTDTIRAASLMERIFHGNNVRCTMTASLTGAVDVPALTKAFRIVMARSPLASACFSTDGTHFRDSGHTPDLVVRKGSEADFVAEINQPFDDAGPRVRCALLSHSSQSHTLVLLADHAVSDGRSIGATLLAIIEEYRRVVEGNPSAAEMNAVVGDPASTRIQHNFSAESVREFVEERNARFASTTIAALPLELNDTGEFRVERVRFSSEDTARFFAVASETGVRGTALLGAVIMSAIAKECGAGEQLLCHCPVDIRPALSPVAEPEELLLAASHVYLLLDRDNDPVAMAGQIRTQLRAAMAQEQQLKEIVGIDQVLASGPVATTASVSNVGSLTLPEPIDGLRVTDMRCMAMIPAPSPTGVALTINGALAVELPYFTQFHSPARMFAVAESVRRGVWALIDQQHRRVA